MRPAKKQRCPIFLARGTQPFQGKVMHVVRAFIDGGIGRAIELYRNWARQTSAVERAYGPAIVFLQLPEILVTPAKLPHDPVIPITVSFRQRFTPLQHAEELIDHHGWNQ